MENNQANKSDLNSSGGDTKVQEANNNLNNNNSKNDLASSNNNDSGGRSNNPKDSRGGGGGGRRDRDRNRSRRRSRSPHRLPRSMDDRSSKVNRRVYVANIPFDVRWGELKDLFREKVGNVRFCQLFENEEGKPRGCGLIEFEDSASAKKAIDVLNRFNFKGRELVVKEDLDIERDRFGRLILANRDDRDRRDHRDRDHRPDHYERYDDPYPNGSDNPSYPTYGLSPQFLNSLGIKGPLNNRVFVANLDYKVSERKLEDVFKLAGKVTKVRLYCDSEGKSKGFGIVEFEHPVEAVQAISMFTNQKLFDRVLSVRLDKFDSEDPFGNDGLPPKLPRGLESIGKGLGIGGQPLNISKSSVASTSMGGVPPAPPPSSIPPVPISPQANVNPQAATAALNVLSNLAGLQNLPTLTQSLAQTLNTQGMTNTTTLPPAPSTGYSTTATEISNATAVPATPAYSGYSTMAPPHGTNVSQVSSPYTNTQMVTPNTYGPPPPSNVAPPASIPPPYSSNTGTPSNAGSISSYSTYDQRDYRNDKYPSSGIDTIFVRNLPASFNWQNLRDRFNEVGEVRFADMKGHGTALVRFASDRDAQRAVELMNGIRIENRAIEVSLYY